MKKSVLFLIRLYQKYLSLDTGLLRKLVVSSPSVRICKFTPTCSEYTYQAVEKYGVLRGGALGFWRIMRCNPLSKGGHDPLV